MSKRRTTTKPPTDIVNADETCKVNDTGATVGAIINFSSTVKEYKDHVKIPVETVITADGLTLGEAKVIIIDVEMTTKEGEVTHVSDFKYTAAKTLTMAEGSKVTKVSSVKGTFINRISTPLVN